VWLVKEEFATMAIKRVLLPVSPDKSFEALSDTAFHIGEKFSAQVMALYVQAPSLIIPIFNDVVSVEEVSTIAKSAQERRREAAAKAESMFKTAAERFPHVDSTFRSVTGDVEASFVRYGRLADISVIVPPDPLEDGFWGSPYWLVVQNAMLFRSGRPVLFMPSHAVRPNFETVVIAWKQSLEAARAIVAAQPLMAVAREVHLFTIDDGEGAMTSLREVEEYLSLHYDEVRSEVVNGAHHEVGKLLLAQAYRLGALLIMGAFSHWRWQERLLGGATDYVLSEASIPVLMMH
jgi:nucleotide-binding universal stress UspA family protein